MTKGQVPERRKYFRRHLEAPRLRMDGRDGYIPEGDQSPDISPQEIERRYQAALRAIHARWRREYDAFKLARGA